MNIQLQRIKTTVAAVRLVSSVHMCVAYLTVTTHLTFRQCVSAQSGIRRVFALLPTPN